MKKFLVSFSLIVVFAFYAMFATTRSGVQSLATTTSVSVPNTSVPNEPVVKVVPTPVAVAPSLGAFKNGTYTGPITDAYYGNVQVQATVSGGKLADVQFLQYPSDRRTSQQINSRATVQLKSEAIQAQSANVNMVSGATETSKAFKISLGSALALAAN
jgi:uncharacterized protein with FMN-binding domain